MKPIAIITAALLALAGTAVAAEKFPAAWRKTMTNDPATNFYLAKYTVDLAEPLQTAQRNFIIAKLVGSLCSGARIDKGNLRKYLARTGVEAAPLAVRRAAYDTARMTFNGFDYRTLAHLCAAVDFMFGRDGKLVPGAGKAGKGEPKVAYDPQNPYFMVESLVPRP